MKNSRGKREFSRNPNYEAGRGPLVRGLNLSPCHTSSNVFVHGDAPCK